MYKGPRDFLQYQTRKILKLGYQHPSHHAVVPPVHPQLNPDHIMIKVEKKKYSFAHHHHWEFNARPCSNAQSKTGCPSYREAFAL